MPVVIRTDRMLEDSSNAASPRDTCSQRPLHKNKGIALAIVAPIFWIISMISLFWTTGLPASQVLVLLFTADNASFAPLYLPYISCLGFSILSCGCYLVLLLRHRHSQLHQISYLTLAAFALLPIIVLLSPYFPPRKNPIYDLRLEPRTLGTVVVILGPYDNHG